MQWSAYDLLLLSSLNLCVALAATPASAADGVIEINHTRALAGGVTPADSPGFPVTISLPGSYVLTSDLTVNGLDTHGIDVFFDDVTIDLAGFTIQGGCPVAGCSAGAGNGLAVYAPGNRNEVRDGHVRGFALGGVALGTRSRITRLMAHDTGGLGISTGSWADIADSQSHSNPHGAGISAGSNSLIRGCVAHSNGQGGISAGAHSIILDSIARINGGSAGITAASGTLVLGNTSAANSSNGIRATGTGSLILENAVSGTTGFGSGGIVLLGAGSVQRNVVSNNIGQSLVFSGSPTGAYRENVADLNGGVTGGINIGGNSCHGTPTCP